MKKAFFNYFVVATFILMLNAIFLAWFTFSNGISDSFDEEDEQVALIKKKSEF